MQHNAVFIADSVQCGYGRTGKFFSQDFAGINADIYSMAKGMGNGFPVGGIIISPKIHQLMVCWVQLLVAIIWLVPLV
jgi:acetylornithine/N-succinyldiaminopimelate aminotransferase